MMAKSTLHYTESKAFFSIALWFIPLKFLWFSENKDSCPWAPIPRALLPVLHAEVLLPCSTHCPLCPPRPLLATTSFKNSFAINKKKPYFRIEISNMICLIYTALFAGICSQVPSCWAFCENHIKDPSLMQL